MSRSGLTVSSPLRLTYKCFTFFCFGRLNFLQSELSMHRREPQFIYTGICVPPNHERKYTMMKLDIKRMAATAMLGLMCCGAALADATLRGTVLSKETGKPMDFVTIQLADAKGKKLAIGTSTGDDGTFEIKDIPTGKYTVHITFEGTVPQERDIEILDTDIQLPPVTLAEDSKMLEEVTVTGVRQQMRFDLDRRVFNVDASIMSAGQSASELLESIPSVEVDQDGEVSLRGNSSVTVWINGKESGLTADNRAQILEQIPAESIERIEVITNPSAKYSPEGTAGIINIVLKQDRRGGYFGSAEIGANTQGGGNASFNINYSDSKWDLYGGIGFRMRHNKGGSWSRRKYDEADPETGDAYFLNSDAESHNHGNNLFLRLGATYYLTQKDEISISGFGMLGHRWGNSLTDYSSNLLNHWSTNTNRSSNRGDMRGAHGELGYTHKWSDTHTIMATLGYNYWGGPTDNVYQQHQEFAGIPDNDVYEAQNQEINTRSVEAKIDYSVRFNDYLKFEAGYNGNYSHENTPVTTWGAPEHTEANLLTNLYNRFIYDNNITAFYVTLGGRAGNFSYSGGVRAEAWQIRTRSLNYGQSEADVPQFKKDRFALFPSLFLSYSLPYDNEIQINYTRRIRRPWGGQLNSFQNISDPTNISYGNPELQPEYSNAFELNYIKSWDNHMLSVSGYLRTSDDLMTHLSYITANNVMYTTWDNVSKRFNSGVEIVGKNQFFNRVLDLTTTINLYQSHLSAWQKTIIRDGATYNLSGDKQNSFAWDVRCMASVRLPWDLSVQATGRYNSRMKEAQGSREPSWTVDLGVRKNLGNWSFSINCRDLFDSRKMHHFNIGDGYTQDEKRWRGGRQIRFTVKYSFGNMKAKKNKMQNPSDMPADGSGYGEGGDM